LLVPDGAGGVSTEVTWNNNPSNDAAGGGVSKFFSTVPSFQSAAGINPRSANPPNSPGRGVPDVCVNADGYQIFVRGQNVVEGGTSASAPLWAGLVARVNQGIGWRAGLLNTDLYAATFSSAFNDITTGDNGA
jgi:kumamolisin